MPLTSFKRKLSHWDSRIPLTLRRILLANATLPNVGGELHRQHRVAATHSYSGGQISTNQSDNKSIVLEEVNSHSTTSDLDSNIHSGNGDQFVQDTDLSQANKDLIFDGLKNIYKNKVLTPAVMCFLFTYYSCYHSLLGPLYVISLLSTSDSLFTLLCSYRVKVLPLEKASKFSQFGSPPLSPSDFEAKPVVLVLGQVGDEPHTYLFFNIWSLITSPALLCCSVVLRWQNIFHSVSAEKRLPWPENRTRTHH